MTTLGEALFKALPELESVKKNAANPHLKSKYANLTAVMAAVEPIRAFGLWYRQVVHDRPDGACVETIYIHESGAELSAGLTFVKAEKQNPQGFGSALTYCRRYSLQCAFGLDAEDDDGHVASKPAPPPEPETPPESVLLFVNDFRAAMKNGNGPAFWEDGYKKVPPQWKPYVAAQKDAIKAEINNQQKAA